MWLKKIITNIQLYFQFFKFMKSQGKADHLGEFTQSSVNSQIPDESVRDKFYLKFNANSSKFLEWADFGNMNLPAYYFLKDGKKFYYLHWCDKTIRGERAFIADKSLTTKN